MTYSYQLDPNRLPLEDMDEFVKYHGADVLYDVWENFKVKWGIYLV